LLVCDFISHVYGDGVSSSAIVTDSNLVFDGGWGAGK
jgi:hypothetical protein